MPENITINIHCGRNDLASNYSCGTRIAVKTGKKVRRKKENNDMNHGSIYTNEMAAALATALSAERGKTKRVMIKFACDCGKHIVAPASSAGKKGYCPKCNKGITIPFKNDKNVLAVRCSCGIDIPLDLFNSNRRHCPECGRHITLPVTHSFLPPLSLAVKLSILGIVALILLLFFFA